MATSPYGSNTAYSNPANDAERSGVSAQYNMASDTPTSAGADERRKRRPAQQQDATQGDAGRAAERVRTFAQMQQAGEARPSPAVLQQKQQAAQAQQMSQNAAMPAQAQNSYAPPPAGNSGMAPQLQQFAQSMLANPSAYNDQAMQAQFSRMAGQIDDQYAQKETATREEMAKRGLTDSSIAGGRLADLNVGKRSAQTELAAQLAEQAANRYTTDRAAAMQAALGVNAQDMQQQQFGQQMGFNYANMAQQGNQFDRSLQQSGSQFDRNLAQQGNQFGQQMGFNYANMAQNNNQFLQNLASQNSQFDRNLGQQQYQFNQNYGLQRDQFDTQRNQFQQNFGEDQRRYNQNFGEQQRQFDKGLDNNRYQFDQGMQQNGLQFLMNLFGPNFATWGNAPQAYGNTAYGGDTMPTLSYGN